MKGLYTVELPQEDTALLAAHREELTPDEYLVMEHLSFGSLPLEYLVKVLSIFDQVTPKYTATKASLCM